VGRSLLPAFPDEMSVRPSSTSYSPAAAIWTKHIDKAQG
jgi:hypothetical protein